MGLVERIKNLCEERKITIAELERNTGISNGQIRKWNSTKPGIDKLNIIADYFDVSVDYLLGRTEQKRYYDLNEKDERDIQRDLEKMIANINDGTGYAAFDGHSIDELDEEDKEMLIATLESTLRMTKLMAKQKFTPKKYRD